jgi:hypothetical protein
MKRSWNVFLGSAVVLAAAAFFMVTAATAVRASSVANNSSCNLAVPGSQLLACVTNASTGAVYAGYYYDSAANQMVSTYCIAQYNNCAKPDYVINGTNFWTRVIGKDTSACSGFAVAPASSLPTSGLVACVTNTSTGATYPGYYYYPGMCQMVSSYCLSQYDDCTNPTYPTGTLGNTAYWFREGGQDTAGCLNLGSAAASSSPSGGTSSTTIASVQGYNPANGFYTANTAVAGTFLYLTGTFAASGNTVSIITNANSLLGGNSSAATVVSQSASSIEISLATVTPGSSYEVLISNSLGSASANFSVTASVSVSATSTPSSTAASGGVCVATGASGELASLAQALQGLESLVSGVGNNPSSSAQPTGPALSISVPGASGNSYSVGQAWKLSVSGGPANAPFSFCADQVLPSGQDQGQSCTQNFGTTDGSGSWTLPGSFPAPTAAYSALGSWREWAAFPSGPVSNQVQFTVAAAPGGSTLAASVVASIQAALNSISQMVSQLSSSVGSGNCGSSSSPSPTGPGNSTLSIPVVASSSTLALTSSSTLTLSCGLATSGSPLLACVTNSVKGWTYPGYYYDTATGQMVSTYCIAQYNNCAKPDYVISGTNFWIRGNGKDMTTCSSYVTAASSNTCAIPSPFFGTAGGTTVTGGQTAGSSILATQPFRYIDVDDMATTTCIEGTCVRSWTWISWGEIELFDANGNGIYIPLNNVSGSAGGSNVGALVDGDPGTSWNAGYYQGYVKIDLGKPTQISKISLFSYNKPDPGGALTKIMVSNDGATYQQAAAFDGDYTATNQQWITYNVSNQSWTVSSSSSPSAGTTMVLPAGTSSTLVSCLTHACSQDTYPNYYYLPLRNQMVSPYCLPQFDYGGSNCANYPTYSIDGTNYWFHAGGKDGQTCSNLTTPPSVCTGPTVLPAADSSTLVSCVNPCSGYVDPGVYYLPSIDQTISTYCMPQYDGTGCASHPTYSINGTGYWFRTGGKNTTECPNWATPPPVCAQ